MSQKTCLADASRETLVHLIEEYRELVSCAWARHIPHEGTEQADHDWCDHVTEELSAGYQEPPVASENGKHPGVWRDQAILDWFNGEQLTPAFCGWRLLFLKPVS